MKLLIKIDNTVSTFYNSIPNNTNNENCGFDLFFDDDYIIQPNSKAVLKFGIKAEVIDSNDNNVAYFLIPRSSIAKTNLIQANSIGLIDASYRGYIMAVVHNIGKTEHYIKKGERLFQLVPINNGKPFDSIEIVDNLSLTTRNTGGFGSTGR